MTFPEVGREETYYELQPLGSTCTIFAPAEGSKVFARPVITREEADRLIDAIPCLRAQAYHNRSMQQLAEHYLESFRSHSCEDLITLASSIYAKKKVAEEQKRKFGQVDEKYMKRAEALLFLAGRTPVYGGPGAAVTQEAAEHMVQLEAGRVRASGPTAELIARLDLPLAQGDAAATVVTGTVIEHAPQDHITCVAFAGGQLLLVSPQARAAGDTVKLRVQARDVSLALSPPQDSSILNIVPATVAEMREDSPGQWMVALQAGPTRLLARVTQRSVHALQLRPGLHVFAQIKGIAIVN